MDTETGWLAETFGWMAWTEISGIFFLTIFCLLVAMTIWEILSPTIERKGFLPIVTTRGDRFFIGLLTSAFIHLAWLGFLDVALVWALAVSAAWMIVLLRYG